MPAIMSGGGDMTPVTNPGISGVGLVTLAIGVKPKAAEAWF